MEVTGNIQIMFNIFFEVWVIQNRVRPHDGFLRVSYSLFFSSYDLNKKILILYFLLVLFFFHTDIKILKLGKSKCVAVDRYSTFKVLI